MKKLWMTLLAVLLAATLAAAQENHDQDKDNKDSAKQDMKQAGHNTKEAAKKVGSATKKAAVTVGHETKKAAVATKDKVRGDDDRAADRAERHEGTAAEERSESAEQEARERAERNRKGSMLPQSDRSTSREEALEHSVHIISGPEVDAGNRSAVIRWETNKTAATDVWLTGGGIRGHRTAYVRGGSRDHRVTFANLRPHTTYNYQIRTREGGTRKEGSFTTR